MMERIVLELEARSVRVRFRILDNYGGIIYFASRRIYIDPRQGHELQLRVLIHEMVHYVEPHWTEEEVLRKESELYAEMLPYQREILERVLHLAKEGNFG